MEDEYNKEKTWAISALRNFEVCRVLLFKVCLTFELFLAVIQIHHKTITFFILLCSLRLNYSHSTVFDGINVQAILYFL